MQFKNLTVFKLTQDVNLDELSQSITPFSAKKIMPSEESSTGFISPHRQFPGLLYPVQQFGVIAVKHQQKTIPSSVLKEQLEEKIDLIKQSEARHITNKEKLAMKEELIFSLLPKVLAKIETISAFIDTQSQLLVINSASLKKAEMVVELIRKALGSFPVVPLTAKQVPQSLFTEWLKQKSIPSPFAMGEKLYLKNQSEETASVRCNGLDFFANEVAHYLDNHFLVESFSLDYQDQLSFTIDQQLIFKQLKLSDSFIDQLEKLDDDLAEFEQNLVFYFNQYIALIHQLISVLGGENAQASITTEAGSMSATA